MEAHLFDSLPASGHPLISPLACARGYAISAQFAPPPSRPPSGTATTVVSLVAYGAAEGGQTLWTSKPTYLFFAFMCCSPFLVVGFATTPMRLGSLSGSNPRLRGQAPSIFLAALGTQL